MKMRKLFNVVLLILFPLALLQVSLSSRVISKVDNQSQSINGLPESDSERQIRTTPTMSHPVATTASKSIVTRNDNNNNRSTIPTGCDTSESVPQSPYLLDCPLVVKGRLGRYERKWFFQTRSGTDPYPFVAHIHTVHDDTVTPQLVRRGCFECPTYYALMNELYSHSRQSVWLVDMGANIGQYSLGAAANGYHAIAFEPTRRNWGAFCHSVVANPHFDERIHLYNVALHQEPAPAKLRFFVRWHQNPSATSMMTTTTDNNNNNNNNKNVTERRNGYEEVEGKDYAWAVSLDMLAKERHLPTESRSSVVLKVDVEGFECKALQGAMKYLSKLDIRYVGMEMSQERLEQCRNRKELFGLFHQNHLMPHIYFAHEETWKAMDVTQWETWNTVNGTLMNETSLYDMAWSRTFPNSTPFLMGDGQR